MTVSLSTDFCETLGKRHYEPKARQRLGGGGESFWYTYPALPWGFSFCTQRKMGSR